MEQFKNMDSSKVFEIFHEISQVPRESKHEEKISNWLKEWAEKRNLEVIQDKVLNVIIKKPATAGMEDAPTVVLQGHMDMVCEKGKDSNHDFSKDPIEWVIKDDFIYANDTTLGADNGIGVAFGLALLDSTDIPHPALEVLITSDEETGMTGAHGLDPKDLKGKVFINIDSEEEGQFFLSCAGGNETRISIPIKFEDVKGTLVDIEVDGMLGGHSGMEIIKERANASKVMGRFLNTLDEKGVKYNLVEINGGQKMNAITRDCNAKIVIDAKDMDLINKQASILNKGLKEEFTPQDPDAKVTVALKDEGTYKAMNTEDSLRVIHGLVLVPFGIIANSKQIEGLVQTSTNLGIVETTSDTVEFVSGLRSSVPSQKNELVEKHNVVAKVIDAKIAHSSFYPAWPFDPNSRIKDIFLDSYKKIFNKDAQVVAIHAGLECGLFKEKMSPDVDFISFGPDMFDVHTAQEHVSISSIDRNWKLLKEVLSAIKNY